MSSYIIIKLKALIEESNDVDQLRSTALQLCDMLLEQGSIVRRDENVEKSNSNNGSTEQQKTVKAKTKPARTIVKAIHEGMYDNARVS